MNTGENSLTTQVWFRGAIAALLVGGTLVLGGRDFLYFYNGPGGDGWKIGQGGVHLFNGHWTRDLPEVRQKALELVNRDRQANGLPPLEADSRLSQAAQQHAEDMALKAYFSDFSSEGKSPSDRFHELGGLGFVAQNIVLGQGRMTYRQLALMERELMYARRDRENLLNPQFDQFGYGIATHGADLYGVQVFRNTGEHDTGENGISAFAPTTVPATQPSPEPVGDREDSFRQGVNIAMAAAVATQSAQTPPQWAAVAQQWQAAIQSMAAVPPEHPRYATAQQKVQEYGRNFDYARQNAGEVWGIVQQAAIAPSLTSDSIKTQPSGDPASPAPSQEPSPTSVAWLLKLFLMLGGAAGLIVLLTWDPTQGHKEEPDPRAENRSSDQRGDRASSRPARARSKTEGSAPWHRQAIQEVLAFLETKGWFNSVPPYKLTLAQPTRQIDRRLYCQLLSLTQDENATIELVKDYLREHPHRSANWCCEQAIRDLKTSPQGSAAKHP